jgi:hypothetical protein
MGVNTANCCLQTNIAVIYLFIDSRKCNTRLTLQEDGNRGKPDFTTVNFSLVIIPTSEIFHINSTLGLALIWGV